MKEAFKLLVKGAVKKAIPFKLIMKSIMKAESYKGRGLDVFHAKVNQVYRLEKAVDLVILEQPYPINFFLRVAKEATKEGIKEAVQETFDGTKKAVQEAFDDIKKATR